MIAALHHTALSVPDLDQALAFYCGVLGFELELRTRWRRAEAIDTVIGLPGSAGQIAMIRLGEARLELFEYQAPTPAPQDPARPVHHHGITHLCLAVVDIEAEYQRLQAAGMTFFSAPVQLGLGHCVYGRDPFGNVIELKED